MLMFWTAMREAAMWRHKVLVEFWYPAGPARAIAMVQHEDIVKQVYSFLGD